MTRKPTFGGREALVQELLAAIKADIPVASGYGGHNAPPSYKGGWRVMDRDSAERVRMAAAALRQSISSDNAKPPAAGGPPSGSLEALLQELLEAIELNEVFATGTGHCSDVPIFDVHDSRAESSRPGWEMVYMDRAQRVEKAAAALSDAMRDVT